MTDAMEPANSSLVNPSDETPAIPNGDPPGTISLRAESWIAPLPSPDDFQRYNETLPGAAERILAMAERQQQHQIEQEKAFADQGQYVLETVRITHAAESGRSKLGIIFAFIIALAGLGTSAGLIATGVGALGLVPLLAPLSSLVGVFIHVDRSRRRNSQDDESD